MTVMLLQQMMQSAASNLTNGIGDSLNAITQENTATGDDFAQISQSNDATIHQNLDLLFSCDESGDGSNLAICVSGTTNFIEPIAQTNAVTGADESDTVVQSNGAQITQNLQIIQDCDEENTGFNFQTCDSDQGNNIDTITQANDATTVGDDTVQSNFLGTSQDLQAINVCDETGVGDNDAECINSPNNSIGPVAQINGADGSGDADFTQNNNIPTINQVIAAENDCDQIR